MSDMKTELKVPINCLKCRIAVMQAVAKLIGVNEVKVDADKGMLTVVGSVDPVGVASALRKAGYYADITSVGPPKKPDDKKPDDKPKPGEKPKSPEEKPKSPLPPYCKQCQLVGVVVDHGGGGCSIL